MMRNMANTAAIIKNIGELMNSGIIDSIPCQSLENTRLFNLLSCLQNLGNDGFDIRLVDER